MREFHPVANIFPLMVESEIADLAADIAAHGLREPIWLDVDGKIIDGRNRFVACQRAQVEPVFQTWNGDGSLIEFVISLNLKRRHLNESQRAIVAAEIANLKRGNVAAQKCDAEISTPAVSMQQAAEMLSVSRDSVLNAKKVLSQATPEEIEAVKQGQAAVGTVAKMIRQGVEPEARKAEVLRPKTWTDSRGRRMPERPTAECMERGIDQLANTIEVLAKIAERPDVADHPNLADWVAGLERARTPISQLINRLRIRRAA